MEMYDTIIIGFGKGGKTLAADLGRRGEKVAVVERSGKMYGGTCINIGCIPTKTLVHRAALAAVRGDVPFAEKSAFYRDSVAEKEKVVSFLRDKNYHNLADHPNIAVYTGTGSFAGLDKVSVEMQEGTVLLTGNRIVINTGAESVVPPIPGVESNPRVYTSTSMLELAELPRRLAIVGGGYIGLEYASMYASFGSRVTVLEGGPELMPREDRDIAECVRQVLERRGIGFRFQAKVTAVEDAADAVRVVWEDTSDGKRHALEADAVLLATGRRPATSSLNLAAAGVETDSRGAVKVDDRLRTSNPNVYAVGDVKGGLQFTYISLDDYRILREEFFGDGGRSTEDRDPVSYCVFIDPPMAHIGMNETQARASGREVRVTTLAAAAIPRARTLGQTEGLLKAVTDAWSGEILGCTLFCAEASEVINTVALAMKTGQKAGLLRDFIFTHPSMSEALNDLFV